MNQNRTPTAMQKLAFEKTLEVVGNKSNTRPMGTIMKEVGYADSMAKNPQKLTGSLGWRLLLATIDDDVLLKRLYELALCDDKRTSLSALQECFRLKGYHPDKDPKSIELFNDL